MLVAPLPPLVGLLQSAPVPLLADPLPGASPAVLVALVCIAFVAGVGITAIGPGGVFTTAALYALTATPPPTVAGTASATFVATGLLGSASYLRSGELREGDGARTAALLALASGVGAVAGARLNAVLPEALFGALLGGFLVFAGVLVVVRERYLSPSAEDVVADESPTDRRLDLGSARGQVIVAVVGVVIGLLGGLLGVGGPVVTVPTLLLLGAPMLLALAAAQVQSVVLAGAAAATYAVQGAVSIPLALLVGVPQLVGMVVGWRVAHRVDVDRLKPVLGTVLVFVGASIAM